MLPDNLLNNREFVKAWALSGPLHFLIIRLLPYLDDGFGVPVQPLKMPLEVTGLVKSNEVVGGKLLVFLLAGTVVTPIPTCSTR